MVGTYRRPWGKGYRVILCFCIFSTADPKGSLCQQGEVQMVLGRSYLIACGLINLMGVVYSEVELSSMQSPLQLG